MRLTRKTDYCLRVLIFLQKNKAKVRIQDIADAYNISKNHLSVAVNKLSELGYIISTQGPKGGIQFNPSVKNNTLADLVAKIENFDIVECFDSKNNKCNISSHCKLKKIFHKSNIAFLDELKRYKISDLI